MNRYAEGMECLGRGLRDVGKDNTTGEYKRSVAYEEKKGIYSMGTVAHE